MDRIPNKNQPWQKSEIDTLHQMWASKATLAEMATAVGRTAGGVASKLMQLNYIYFSQKSMGYHLVDPIITLKQIQNIDKRLQEDPYQE